MIAVTSAFKRYNANSRNNNVGDCVKRALSFAYGMDYDEVSRILNRIKTYGAYNSPSTFTKFLKEYGAEYLGKTYAGMTEEEFSEQNNHGVYILLTGPASKSDSTHMVCIFNGDIVDSWNSSNYVVHETWKINNTTTDLFTVNYSEIEPQLNAFIDKYLESVDKKYSSWFKVTRGDASKLNDLTYKVPFTLHTSENLPHESEYYPNRKHVKRIVIKLNPRMTSEQNLQSLKTKLKQAVYDWIYPYEKDMRDVEAIKTVDNAKYTDAWSKRDLLRLPSWVRSLVTYYWFDDKYGYELRFTALPDDPYIEERGDKIEIEEDTYKEMISALDAYKKSYARTGWDY